MTTLDEADGALQFGAFRLDRSRGSLLRGDESVSLRPKTWEVLNYLAERPGVLVSPDTLYDAVWPGVAVTPKTLTNVIAELRRALKDDSDQPRYIETVHRRGYRFIARAQATAAAPVATPITRSLNHPIFIGRTAELASLASYWQSAIAGQGQMVLLAGEPGIGKTTLLNEFLVHVSGHNGNGDWIARGQCIERHGAHEAYMPALEAIASLAPKDARGVVAKLLGQYAPTWLEQIPWLIPAEQRKASTAPFQGGSATRMLREGARIISALAEHQPLVLLLEDVHWSDPETLDLVTTLGQRLAGARLLVICTYRPTEARVNNHPLVSVVSALQRCGAVQMMLDPFTLGDVSVYLEHRFPGSHFDRQMTSLVEDHSGGNPLLVRAVCDHMSAKGLVRADGDGWRVSDDIQALDNRLPDTVRDIIEAQLGLLDRNSLEVLEVAAVAGFDFSAPAVAAGLGASPESAERSLRSLRGAWLTSAELATSHNNSNGPSTSYAFAHSLYQRVLYDRIPEHRRQRLHQHIGEHLESFQNDHNRAMLATHFERSGDHARAVQHLEEAARAVGRRASSRDVTVYLQRALAQLRLLPDGSERAARELRLQVAVGEAATQAFGPDDPLVTNSVQRVRELCPQVDDPSTLFQALHGLWLYTLLKGDSRATRELVHQTMTVAERNQLPEIQLLGELMCGTATCFEGWPLLACEHLNKAAKSLSELSPSLPPTGLDVAVELRCNLAWASWLSGYPDRARRIAHEALAIALENDNPNNCAVALIYLFNIQHLCGDWNAAHQCARDLQVLGEQRDLILSQRTGMILEAAVLMEEAKTDEAMAALQQSGASNDNAGLQQIVRTFFLGRVALACGRMGIPVQGLMLIAEAMNRIAASGLATSEAEILRIRGELVRQLDGDTLVACGLGDGVGETPDTVADDCFGRAIDIARKQGSKAWELRAITSRSRLWLAQGKRDAARQLLASTYAWFEEGFDTVDLRDAAELLATISS